MLSPISLAAFSAGAAQAGFGQARGVQGVRAVGGQPPQPAVPAVPGPLPPRDGDVGGAPGRILPRGSLLDLSV